MKKTITLIFIVLFSAAALQAQTFKTGDNVVGAGVGLGSALNAYSGAKANLGFSVNFERGIWDLGPGVVSLGGYAGKAGFKYSGSSGSYTWEQKWNYTVIGARGAYHYTGFNSNKFDVYAGAMVSYNILNYQYSDNDDTYNYSDGGSYGSGVGATAYIGGRYYFSENFGAYSELGYGASFLNIGLVYKF